MAGDADLEIEEAFRRAQKAHNNKAKLVVSLKTRYDKVQHNYVNYRSKVWGQYLTNEYFFFFF